MLASAFQVAPPAPDARLRRDDHPAAPTIEQLWKLKAPRPLVTRAEANCPHTRSPISGGQYSQHYLALFISRNVIPAYFSADNSRSKECVRTGISRARLQVLRKPRFFAEASFCHPRDPNHCTLLGRRRPGHSLVAGRPSIDRHIPIHFGADLQDQFQVEPRLI